MTRFQALLKPDSTSTPMAEQERASRQLPDVVRSSRLKWWTKKAAIPAHGKALLLVIAPYSHYDLALLDVLDAALGRPRARKGLRLVPIYVADLLCSRPAAVPHGRPAERRYTNHHLRTTPDASSCCLGRRNTKQVCLGQAGERLSGRRARAFVGGSKQTRNHQGSKIHAPLGGEEVRPSLRRGLMSLFPLQLP